MAYPGQTIENPASGERITFRQTAAETNGELVAVDLELPQDARVPGGLHSHPLQQERFEVVKGTMRFSLGGERIIAGPGTVVIVPPGIPHDFANAGNEDALVRVEIRPALKIEQLFETAVALAEQGRTMMKGIPKPLDLALFTREFEQEVQVAFPPLWLQRLALAPLAWLAKHRGYANRYAPMNQCARPTFPRGLIVGTLAAVALIWGLFAIDPARSLVSSGVQTAVLAGLLVLTARSRRIKILLVRTVQRWTVNPLMRLLLAIGTNPLGLAILETRGRSSGKPRQVPVGNGRKGDAFWIIAEHGTRAEYVRNIQQDPRVRVRLRVGLRYRWVPGIATVLPDDDPLARQRRIIRWHPLRAFNAINVRVLGADLLTVHVQLMRDGSSPPTATSTRQAPQTPIAGQIPAPVGGVPAR